MAKRKAGLHRKISSIFDGVAIPKSDSGGQDRSAHNRNTPTKGGEDSKQQTDSMPKGQPTPGKPAGIDKPPQVDKPATPGPEKAPKPPGRPAFDPYGPIPAVSEKRRKTTIVLMVVLFATLVLVLTLTFSPNFGREKTSEDSEIASSIANAAAGVINTEVNWGIPPEYPRTLRDPMDKVWVRDNVTGEWVEERVLDTSSESGEDLIDVGVALRSICLYGESGRSVVIDDEILYEGDTILGVTIKKINKDSVEFEREGEGFLKVFPR